MCFDTADRGGAQYRIAKTRPGVSTLLIGEIGRSVNKFAEKTRLFRGQNAGCDDFSGALDGVPYDERKKERGEVPSSSQLVPAASSDDTPPQRCRYIANLLHDFRVSNRHAPGGR
jgi:hypothetical protein